MNAKTIHRSAKEIAEEFTNKLWNDKDTNIIDKLVDQKVVIHSPLGNFHGTEALKKVAHTWLQGFPDLRVHNELIISENGLVSIQWHAEGTHRGEFKGRSPTGKRISYSGVTIYRIANGHIVEYWAYLDMDHLFHQI